MNFNTKYILPGDDKSQIISKVNQNFSQVYYAGVGLQGERGIIGPTGIVGQVGKNGITGAGGERANIWIFQDEPPGIYSNYPVPLENYDIWVNTSPTGSTGGPNRMYRFDSNYGGGDFGFFWIDTGENFVSGNTFTLLQGVSGPPGISSRNAILADSNSTFVFSDDSVISSNANPNYSKALISTRDSVTAQLPIFTFGKTFYEASNPPSFLWKNTTDYSVQFSSSESLYIESQATGSYSATGGTFGVEAKNFILNVPLNFGITGPSGISVSSSSFGVSSPNLRVENTVSFPTQNSGFVVGASSSGNSLTAGNTKLFDSTDPRVLTVLNFFGGPSGGTLKPNVNFSMSGSSLFRINNASSGSYPTLSIGYTGSIGITGPSGGTGANIYKSYQTITSSATSKKQFDTTDSSNYIEVTPSSDVIRIVPQVPTGTTISSNGRVGRIWIYLTGLGSYVESLNISEVDIFLDVAGMTSYSIGGVAVQNLAPGYLGELYQTLYIDDFQSGSSAPGNLFGCRQLKITIFGDSFPSSINPSPDNKYVFVQAFCGDGIMSIGGQQLIPYSPPQIFAPGQLTVICSELYSQGFMSSITKEADEKFGEMILRESPEVMKGYHYWAIPIVEMMKKSRTFTRIVWMIAKPWSDQMVYEMGYSQKGNLFGKILMEVGILFSRIIGKIISSRNLGLLEKKKIF